MKTIYFSLLALTLLTLNNCRRDDENSESGSIKQKLIGKWYFSNPNTYGYDYNNSFTFSSDNKVEYKYWAGTGSGNNFESEIGSYTINDDKLKMTFSKTATLTYVQKVNFISDKKVEFLKTENQNEQSYNGIYFKAN